MSTKKPREFDAGTCFVCKKKCDEPWAYCHIECAVAYADEKAKRIKEAKID